MKRFRTFELRQMLAVLIAGLCLIAGAGLFWQRVAGASCDPIRLTGLQQTDIAMLRAIVGPVRDPGLVEDRIRRHPWVRWAQAHCGPLGSMHVRITERKPVLRVLPEGDEWGHYIDRRGFRMPATAAFDVPLLRGDVEPYHPVMPVSAGSTRRLAHAVARHDVAIDALLSEFVVGQDGIRLYTPSVGPHASLEVRLGRGGYDDKLKLLAAFWYQAVLAGPEPAIRWIDLRFERQVVTGTKQEHQQELSTPLL